MGRTTYGGRATVLGSFISADQILPARYSFSTPQEATLKVLDEIEPSVNASILLSKAIVAGEAFGYGSGRESPARALRAAGIELIVGKSFGRIFYRNAINLGMLPVECPDIVEAGIVTGDEVIFDTVENHVVWRDFRFRIPKIPTLFLELLENGGLTGYACRHNIAGTI